MVSNLGELLVGEVGLTRLVFGAFFQPDFSRSTANPVKHGGNLILVGTKSSQGQFGHCRRCGIGISIVVHILFV